MSCGNLYKHMFKNAVNSFLDIFTSNESNTRALTDDKMECMQFGICYFDQKPIEEIPYFHY